MRVSTLIIAFALALSLVSSGAVLSADLEKGMAAYLKGDYATALQEWEPLAEQGHAEAQYHLGTLYDFGDGVPQNYEEAAKWYRLAAEKGEVASQYSLGDLHRLGKGVPQNYKEAVKWYRLAAEQGLAEAQNSLGVSYYLGKGVRKNYVYAYVWLTVALSNGYGQASKGRNLVIEEMNSKQIAEANELVGECQKNGYKGC